MLALLHVQHHHRPGEVGAVHGLLQERDLVRAYLAAARGRLLALGVRVEVYDPAVASYGGVHSLARTAATGQGPAVYVAGHVNAGGGTYGLVGHDHRSKRGAGIARTVAAALGRACPELSRVRVEALSDGSPISPRGYNCIDGIYSGPLNLSAILLEPGFIDAANHASLWTVQGLVRLGIALADGIHAHLSSETSP